MLRILSHLLLLVTQLAREPVTELPLRYSSYSYSYLSYLLYLLYLSYDTSHMLPLIPLLFFIFTFILILILFELLQQERCSPFISSTYLTLSFILFSILRKSIHQLVAVMDPRTTQGDSLLHLSVSKSNTLKTQVCKNRVLIPVGFYTST